MCARQPSRNGPGACFMAICRVIRILGLMRGRTCSLAALLVLGVASGAAAQGHGSLAGVVRDTAGNPIADADVAIVALRQITKTEGDGSFRFRRVGVGLVEVTVRRLGFHPAGVAVEIERSATESLTVVMMMQPAQLEGVQVQERDLKRLMWIEDFYRRRVRGMGKYVTRDEIEARHASRLSDAMRDIPGVLFVRIRGGHGIRFASSIGNRRECVPQFFVDAVRMAGMEIDDIPPSEVEGIELYHGPSTTPLQFSQGSIASCGTVVIWTRAPGSE